MSITLNFIYYLRIHPSLANAYIQVYLHISLAHLLNRYFYTAQCKGTTYVNISLETTCMTAWMGHTQARDIFLSYLCVHPIYSLNILCSVLAGFAGLRKLSREVSKPNFHSYCQSRARGWFDSGWECSWAMGSLSLPITVCSLSTGQDFAVQVNGDVGQLRCPLFLSILFWFHVLSSRVVGPCSPLFVYY